MDEKEVKAKWEDVLLGISIEETALIAGYALQRLVLEGKLKQSTLDDCFQQLDAL